MNDNSSSGYTPLMLAVRGRAVVGSAERHCSLDMVKLLLDRGADPNTVRPGRLKAGPQTAWQIALGSLDGQLGEEHVRCVEAAAKLMMQKGVTRSADKAILVGPDDMRGRIKAGDKDSAGNPSVAVLDLAPGHHQISLWYRWRQGEIHGDAFYSPIPAILDLNARAGRIYAVRIVAPARSTLIKLPAWGATLEEF